MAHMLGIKLGSLFVKTLTKPLANGLKRRAQNEGFLRSLCIKYGRAHHRVNAQIQLKLIGMEPVKIKEINDELALQTGAGVISEAFVFTTAAALLIFELTRKSRDDAAAKLVKEEKERAEKDALEQRFIAMETWMKQSIQQTNEDREKLEEDLKEIRKRIDKSWIV